MKKIEDNETDLMWCLKQIENHLAENYSPATNIMNIITHVQGRVEELLIRKDKDFKKSEWGTDKKWGILKVKYKPTGEIRVFDLGIKRMKYANELIFCCAWGYDEGHPTDLNHPDNYEVLSVIESK